MATEAALIARLEVKLTTLERQLKKAGAMAEGAVLDIEKKFAKANPKLGGAVAFGSFIGNLAGAGAQVAIRALQDMAQEMRALGDTSRLTGLALKDVYAIQQAIGGKSGDVNAALSSITTLLDRAQRGEKNALGELLKVNGQDIKNVKDAADAWSRVVDIISRAKTEVQAQEMGKMLGISPEVVNNIRAAGGAYEDFGKAAADAASSVDLESLSKLAAEFDEAWTRAVKHIESLFLSGFASMRGVILQFLADTATVLEGVERFQAGLRAWVPGFQNKVGQPGQIAEDIRNKIARNWRPTDDEAPAGRGGAAPPPGGFSKPAAFDWNKKGRGPKGPDDIQRYIEQLREQNDLLTAEEAALGLSNEERVKSIALAKLHAEARQAGRAPTQQEIDDTLRLAAGKEKLAESIKKTEEAYALVNAEAKSFLSTLVGDLRDGVDAAEALANALQGIADRLMDRALDSLIDTLLPSKGGGPLGSLFSGMLPKFAAGGVVPGSGPVPIMAHGGEIVVPKAQARSIGGSVVNFAPVIDARGADAGQIAVLRTEMRALIQTATPKIAAAVVRDRGRAW